MQQLVQQLQQQVQQLQQPQQQQQQQQGGQQAQGGGQQPPAPRFAITPSSYTTGFLDFSSKNDVILFSKACEGLYEDPSDRHDLVPDQNQNFLSRVYDKGVNYNLSILSVPINMAQIPAVQAGQPYRTKNFCQHHGELSMELIRAFANTYIGRACRAAQDDRILSIVLQKSLTESAYATITADREEYTVNGEPSGLVMLKLILTESAVDTTVDPDIIRREIAQAPAKFAELNYNVRKFNDFIRTKVSQLKQKGETTTDLRTHIFAAYSTSNDPEFRRYIQTQRDYIRDHPTEEYSYKTLMNRAKDKADSLEVELKRQQIQPTSVEDPIVSLQAKVRAQKKSLQKLAKQSQGSGGGGKNGKEKTKRKKKNGKEYIPFPAELRTKEQPADPSKPVVIDGVQYWWCPEHKKWGRHTHDKCEKRLNKDKKSSTDDKPKEGGRSGRLVRALGAVIEG